MKSLKKPRKLKRKYKTDIKKTLPARQIEEKHEIKKYKTQKCAYVSPESGKRCKRNAVGKGTLCAKHGGNPKIKENLIPVTIENHKLVLHKNKFNPAKHPMEYIDLSRQGLSEVEIAARFEVSAQTVRAWAERFESFSLAHEIGQAMHESWWIEQGKNNLNARDFNTPLFKFLTSNKLGYSDKMETKNTNLNVHGVLKVPDSVTEDEWESEDIIDV